AALTGPGNDLGLAVAVHVGGDDVYAAREAGIVREELHDQVAGHAVEDFDVRAAALAGAGDNVGRAVAVDVADGDADAALERLVVGHELEAGRAGAVVEHADQGWLSGVAGGDHEPRRTRGAELRDRDRVGERRRRRVLRRLIGQAGAGVLRRRQQLVLRRLL